MKEKGKIEGGYSRNLTPLKRIGDINHNSREVDSKKEFESISKKGFIRYTDENGVSHDVPVRCKESIVEFDDEKDIGKRLNPEICYQYDILDNNGNVLVTIYKSKDHNKFSMSQLMSVYDNLNKTLVKDCNEIILSNHVLDDSGGFVLESNPHRVHIMSITGEWDIESVLIHEMAHSFDMSNNISDSEEYKKLVREHPSKLNPYDETDERYFAEDFAYSIEELYSDFGPSIVKTIYLYKLLGIM